MLYALKMQSIQQDDIVYFMTSIQVIQKQSLPFVFIDVHAIRRLTNFYTNLENLREIDWDVMKSKVWTDTDDDPNRKARRQAEFLVHNEVPLSACLGFAVYSNRAKKRVEKLLENNDLHLRVATRTQFYY